MYSNSGESVEMSGFYYIEGFKRYVINPEGVVYDLSKKVVVPFYVSKKGYFKLTVITDDNKSVRTGRHRFLGIAFIKHPPDISRLVINHLNGIPGDDRLNNLEWTTYQGNAEHAGMMGLTTKCRPISVRDCITGEVKHYKSIIQYAKEVGYSKDACTYRVKAGEKQVWPEKKQYRYFIDHTEEKPWYIPPDLDLALLDNSTSKPVMLKYYFTGVVMNFSKITDLATYLNLPVSTISIWLDRKDQPMLPGFIQMKKRLDPAEWREIIDPYIELDKFTNDKCVRTVNISTGEVTIYYSAIECARARGLNATALNYRLKFDGIRPFSDGYTYCYYSTYFKTKQGHLNQ